MVIVAHIGETMHSGHYIAFIRCGPDWWKVNDSKVSSITLQDLEAETVENGYIVCYARLCLECKTEWVDADHWRIHGDNNIDVDVMLNDLDKSSVADQPNVGQRLVGKTQQPNRKRLLRKKSALGLRKSSSQL